MYLFPQYLYHEFVLFTLNVFFLFVSLDFHKLFKKLILVVSNSKLNSEFLIYPQALFL